MTEQLKETIHWCGFVGKDIQELTIEEAIQICCEEVGVNSMDDLITNVWHERSRMVLKNALDLYNFSNRPKKEYYRCLDEEIKLCKNLEEKNIKKHLERIKQLNNIIFIIFCVAAITLFTFFLYIHLHHGK